MTRDGKMEILCVLERLNLARIAGETELAADLDRELDALDRRLGYSRSRGFLRTDDQRVRPISITRRERPAP